MPTILSTPVNTALIPSYFSYLPVRIHKEVAAVDAATFHAIESCAQSGSKEYRQAIYRHTNPEGNPYALCHGECDIKKLEWFVKVVELIWIDDDVTEELAHAEALHEHEILRQALHPAFDNDLDTGKTVGVKKAYLRAAREGMMLLDPIHTPSLLDTLDKYLQEYDGSDVDFQTTEEYLPYRIPNAGYRVCSHFIRWAMDIHLTEDEYNSVKEFEWTLGGVLALTNDYFSWNKEKYQSTDRVRNAIPLLMRQHGLTERPAKLLLKGMIIEEEEKAQRMRMKLEKQWGDGMSYDLKRYIEALELYAGGNCYWSATCPRYDKPQEEEEKDLFSDGLTKRNELSRHLNKLNDGMSSN